MCPGLDLDLDNLSLRLTSKVNLDWIKLTIKTNHSSHPVNSVPLENPDKHKWYVKPPFRNNLKQVIIEHIPAKRLDQKNT